MTISWHGNGHRWIPLAKVMWNFNVFFVVSLNKQLNTQSSCRWFKWLLSYLAVLSVNVTQGHLARLVYGEPSLLLGRSRGCNDNYRQTSNIRHALVGNTLVDHSDAIGASPVGIFILDLTAGFNGLSKDSCKTNREIFEFLVWCALY